MDDVLAQKERIARAVHSAKETRRTGYDDLLEQAATEAKVYPLPVPSRLEQQYMAAARQRQRENIVTKQVVWGKEFKGVAFFPKPAAIQFKDFEVGRMYTQKVVLTNISYTFNAFKILPLPNAIRDFFDITYPLQGAMSAGTSCVITVTFQPKLNEDIVDELPALAQTGPFSIPLICLTKKVAIEVQPGGKRLDFGQVVLAESMTQTITVLNHGALPTEFRILGDLLQHASSAPDLSQSALDVSTISLGEGPGDDSSHQCITIKPRRLEDIEVDAHSQVRITLTFHPRQLCQLDSHLVLRFADSYTQDHTLFVTGQGVDIPVFVNQRNVIDLQCCYYDSLYRDTAVLRSRGKTSMRCQPLVPPELKNYLAFVPKMGFIQPGKTIDFQFKFTPDSRIKQHAASFYDAESQLLQVPIQVDVQGQAMPIYFTIRAFLTPSTLVFEPTALDFGLCCVEEGLTHTVSITNMALLPQEIGFVGIPPEIEIHPNNGFASMLPRETVTFHVEFRPTRTGDHQFHLRLKTARNEEYALPVTGVGRSAPLRFSEALLRLKRTALGETVETSVLLHNPGKVDQRFAFEVPPNCGLTLRPASGEVRAGAAEPVLVHFAAEPELFEPPPLPPPLKEAEVTDKSGKPGAAKATAPTPKKKGKEPVVEERADDDQLLQQMEAEQEFRRLQLRQYWQQGSDPEPFSFHRRLQVACHVEGWELRAVFLEVHLTVVLPEFVMELVAPPQPLGEPTAETAKKEKGAKKPAPKKPDAKLKSAAEDDTVSLASTRAKVVNYRDPQAYLTQAVTQLGAVHFGDVPSGKAVSRVLLIRRVRGAGPQDRAALTVQPLDPFGPFSIVKTPEPLAPGEVCEVIVQFRPNSESLFHEQLIVASSTCQVMAPRLIGRGLWPSLQVASVPPHPRDTDTELYFHMGSALAGEAVERQIKLTNPCSFDLSFEVQFRPDSVEPSNWDGSLPFAVSPFAGVIPKGDSVTVTVVFLPDHEFHAFRAVADLFFGREDTKKTLHFAGSGWNQGMHLMCPTGFSAGAPQDPFDPPLGVADGIAVQDLVFFSRDREDLFLGLGEDAPERRYILEFHCDRIGDTASHTLLLGNVKSIDPKRPTGGGEFLFEGLTDLDQRYGFRMDLLKSNVEAGGRRQCTVTFTPTPLVLSTMPVSGITVTCIATVRCILKGGTPPHQSAAAPEQVATLVLKGFTKVNPT
eukprot:GGOE01043148.1.p1 GENE.GGOE01043148.1~~GGOE01043148.1.p1  ORF type:complete len:1201 (-),score=427.59 GGOE01043148.1:199-3801(-)